MAKIIKLDSKGLKDFEEIALKKGAEMLYNQVLNSKKYIENKLPKYSNRLFSYIAERGPESEDNPFPKYTKKRWSKLSDKYIKRKKHSKFWFYKGTLKAYLSKADRDLTEIFGETLVTIDSFQARLAGKVKINYTIKPYPRGLEGMRGYTKGNEPEVYNRLFGQHRWDDNFISNEEDRPLIEPGMIAFVKRSLSRRVGLLLREGLKK